MHTIDTSGRGRYSPAPLSRIQRVEDNLLDLLAWRRGQKHHLDTEIQAVWKRKDLWNLHSQVVFFARCRKWWTTGWYAKGKSFQFLPFNHVDGLQSTEAASKKSKHWKTYTPQTYDSEWLYYFHLEIFPNKNHPAGYLRKPPWSVGDEPWPHGNQDLWQPAGSKAFERMNVWMEGWMDVGMHVFAYFCIHTHTCIYIYIYIRVWVYTYTHMQGCMLVHMYTQVCGSFTMCIYMCRFVCRDTKLRMFA